MINCKSHSWEALATLPKKRVGIEEVLKRKTVVLLISDLDHIAEVELSALTRTYDEAKTKSDLTYISYFWTRLESMWYSRTQHGKNAENDRILQEVSGMLSFDGSEQEWAVISNGSTEMVRANGYTILKIFEEKKPSEEEIKQKGFVPVLNDFIEELRQLPHCNKLLIPWPSTGIPEKLPCADCARPMEKYFMFRCCTD